MFKVVGVSNYNHDSFAEVLVKDFLEELEAKTICDKMNVFVTQDVWYTIKSNDYRLWRGMEEYI